MTKHEARKIATAAGFDIREGSYQGTADDVLGTWYVTHETDDGFRPYGRGYETQIAAWRAAAEEAKKRMREIAHMALQG